MMDLCFFTMSDRGQRNRGKLSLARNLIFSGEKFGIPVWYFRIPNNEDLKRYKIKLLQSDLLPEARKYIYMDADCLLLRKANWKDPSIMGARLEKPRSHNLNFKHLTAKADFKKALHESALPECNTGCVVIPGEQRKAIGNSWAKWCRWVDNLLSTPSGTRDQFHFRFVRKEFNLPELPQDFCSLPTIELIHPNAAIAHFTAFSRSFPKYYAVHEALMGKDLSDIKNLEMMGHVRWKVIVDLVLKFAENPTHPVGAEVGVHKGDTTVRLMRMLPGLKLYCIDPWQHFEKQKKPWDIYYPKFQAIKALYPDRIIEQRTFSLNAKVDELLDFVFIDADHSSEAVEKDIRFWEKKVKPGGVVIGHDINFRGTYYGRDSVKKGVEAVYGKNYNLGAGFTWWKRKPLK